jgi:endonuclease/exonuclease/phosphatase family metal-dependent hydrolase
LPTAAVAAGTVLLLDTIRVWLPSVIFVYGRAGDTPATEMGAFALVPFALAFGGVVAVRFLPSAPLAAVAATSLAAARLALQLTAGGDPQLWLSTVGATAGLIWLVAVAGGALAGRTAAAGLVAGLAADALLHTLLRSTGLAWRGGLGAWVALLAITAVVLAGAWRSAPAGAARGTGRAWFAVGPLLVLHALLGGVVSHLHTVTSWPETAAAGVVAAAHGLAAACGLWVVAHGRARSAARVGALLVLAGLGAMLTVPSGPGAAGSLASALAAVGHVMLPVGAAVAVAALVGTPRRAAPIRPAFGCAAGLLAFLALAFGYYAAYDLLLPFDNRLLLWAAAGMLTAVAALAPDAASPEGRVERTAVPAGVTRRTVAQLAVLPIAAALLAAGVVAFGRAPATATTGAGLPVRVATYNIQMGFDVHGRHDLDGLVRALADERPALVGLQEVSRGWLINAATDALPRLAEELGMSYAFTPAADAVWGNALLSRHPLRIVEEVVLPRGEAPMPRSAQAAIVDLGAGVELGVVNTHLSHRTEEAGLRAQQIAIVDDLVRRLADGGRPVVLIGDLNAEPGSPELAPLEAWLDQAWDDAPAGTWPSWGPVELIDHILLSGDLTARDHRVGETLASDHLPVFVTVDAGP